MKASFEKILIQYEYLHQVSQQEAFGICRKVIKEESRDLIVYHGSCYDFEKIDLNMSHNRRDFGKGVLYNSTSIPVKKEWAYRLSFERKKRMIIMFMNISSKNLLN